MTRLNQVEWGKRKQTRESIKRLDDHRKAQLELFNESIIKPIKKDRELIRDVLMSRVEIEKFVAHSEAVSKLLRGLIKENGND